MPRMMIGAMMMIAVMPAMALAAGRPAEITCLNAGYRAGSVAFDMCVARVGGDDPLAVLEGGELSAHADKRDAKPGEPADPLATLTPAQTTVPTAVTVPAAAREEIPASFNTPVTLGQPVPSAPPPSLPSMPVGGGWPWPTPPTAPTFPSVATPSVPAWNFGGQ